MNEVIHMLDQVLHEVFIVEAHVLLVLLDGSQLRQRRLHVPEVPHEVVLLSEVILRLLDCTRST
jgi:hypothetical protein